MADNKPPVPLGKSPKYSKGALAEIAAFGAARRHRVADMIRGLNAPGKVLKSVNKGKVVKVLPPSVVRAFWFSGRDDK